jgi:hypothetical protein
MAEDPSEDKPLCRTTTRRALKSGLAHPHSSIEKPAMRVSPDDPHIGDACQFITKVNERAFIYTRNFGTYDGQKIWNPNLHSGTHGGARRCL